ncbi:OB-fold nucleic acid binding domain-containing protein [Parasphingorhabdus pacifica]
MDLTRVAQDRDHACNKRVIESLIKADAFDSLGLTRMALTQHHEAAGDAVIGIKRHEAMGQFDLFGGADDTTDTDDTSPLAHLQFTDEEWPRKQLLAYEREMLGLYVSAHPLDGAERLLAPYQDTSIAELVGGERESGGNGKEEAKIAGMISGIQRRLNKNGQPWAIVTLEDFDASVEVLFFPKSYELFSDCLAEDNALAVKGRVNEREGEVSVFASDAVPVDIAAAEHAPSSEPPLVLRADAKKIDKNTVAELRDTLGAYHGASPVHIHLGATRLELPAWPVKVCTELVSELKSVRGIAIERAGSA